MSRWIRGELALGFLLASLFWVCILGWQAAYAPSEAEKQDCYEAAKHAGHKNEECKTLWERTTTDPVALFTLVLAVSTVGLWAATIGLYRAGERQIALASIAADAAAKSAEAAIGVERPVLHLRNLVISFDRETGGARATFTIVNLGRTPAILQNASIRFYKGRLPELIDGIPFYGRSKWAREFRNRVILEKEELSDLDEVGIGTTVEPYSSRNTYLAGYFLYSDVFGILWQTGFCYGYQWGARRLRGRGPERRGGKAYNYDRIIATDT